MSDLADENAALRTKLEAAEGRIKRARETLLVRWVGGGVLTHKQMIDRTLDALSEPANAEGNAREQRDALLHFGQGWQRRAEAAEGQIEQARVIVAARILGPEDRPMRSLIAALLPVLEPDAAEEKLLHDWKRVLKDPRGSYWRCRRCGAQENGWVVRPKLSGCSANAEGIASEGGSAKAANPDGFRADAPSAEVGHQPDPRGSFMAGSGVATCPHCHGLAPIAELHTCPTDAPSAGTENWTGQRPATDVYGLAAERLANPALTVPAEEVLGSLDDQPDWQALAGELAEALLLAAHSQATEAVVVMGAKQALARYDEAIVQHSGEGS